MKRSDTLLSLQRKYSPKPRIKIKHHRIWTKGRRAHITDYKWRQMRREIIKLLNNSKTTLRDLADYAFDSNAKISIEFKEIKEP